MQIKKLVLLLFCFGLHHLFTVNAQTTDPNLKIHYSFGKNISDPTLVTDASGNGYNGTLKNGAFLKNVGNYEVMDLGATNGYLDLGSNAGNLISTLSNFTVSTYICVDASTDLGANGNFVWTFANSTNMATTANGNMFFSAKSTRYAISKTNWQNESTVNVGSALAKGVWVHVAYTQENGTGNIYINGQLKKTGTIANTPSVLGATAYNYIGKSCYSGDAYLTNSLLHDFRIYNKALTSSEISASFPDLEALNTILITEKLEAAKNALVLSNLEEVKANLILKGNINGVAVCWTSSNEEIISKYGKVSRPLGSNSINVTLTATLTFNNISVTKEFVATVMPLLSDKMSVTTDTQNLQLTGNLNNLKNNLVLPLTGTEGSVISWKSDNQEYLSNTGSILKYPAKGSGKVKVILTATITKGLEVSTKTFEIYIAEDEGFIAYLFAYFTGNSIAQEAIRFAVSNDGFNFRALNNNSPVISSQAISSTGGVRDPHILRGDDGNYYMVVTDMVSANGWDSNRAMVLLKSSNLIDWQSSVINIETTYPEFTNLKCVWAPQTIYDKSAGKYMVYWAMRQGSNPNKIYYAYANSTFTALESAPKLLFEATQGVAVIDADIIERNGVYNLFYKTESGGAGIKKAVSTTVTGGYVELDKLLDQTTDAVEGSGVFKLINSDTYVLMYDCYTTGRYQFTTSTDLENFTIYPNTSMNFTPRHGTVMPITQAEAEVLAKKWATAADLFVFGSNSPSVKKINVDVNTTAKTVYLPVKAGTDLSSFNPQLLVLPGATITPKTPQNFTSSPVDYTISIEGKGTVTYKFSAQINNNPVLEGYYADPEILYSKKTGKYYIYPTSDGFTGWSGTFFKTFSSENLRDWKDEGVILDLPTDVSWASTNAWAPTIIEKMIDGKYKYFYYFCAAQKIGVAVAEDPAGPFTDSGKPLIASSPTGSGQQIDPDVFYDEATGKNYIIWGNGYLARAELNADMISVNQSTIKVITPNSTFREGVEVFKRNGLYYYLWSVDDTRSPDYCVRYATSTSMTGALTIPTNNLVIAKDASNGIYATGHNCVLNIPGTDKWYIIYHRFNRPNGITMGDAAGYNREVCIDELKFAADGSIIQVIPTLKGIDALTNTTSIKDVKKKSR